ncbi:hypothetical protein D9M70_604330 [compost metagenome]
MKGQNSTEIDESKIEGHIEKIAKTLSEQHLERAKSIIQSSGEHPRNLIRGHFLASLAQKHIAENLKKSGRTPNISFEAIYASAIGAFKRLITKCDEKNYYQAAVDNALTATGIKNLSNN